MPLGREPRDIAVVCHSKVAPPNIEEVLSPLAIAFMGGFLLVGISDVLRWGRWIWDQSSGCRCASLYPGNLVLLSSVLTTSMESVKTKDLNQAASLSLTEKGGEFLDESGFFFANLWRRMDKAVCWYDLLRR